MPFILRVWSPGWFVPLWVGAYGAISVFFMFLAMESWWSFWAAAMFAMIPVSAVAWSERPEDYWAATTVAIVFIAFETAALPYLRIGEWRTGPILVGCSIIGAGLFVIHPIVSIALLPILLSLINAADRSRKLKMELESHLAVAQRRVLYDPLTGLLNRRGLQQRAEELHDQDITIALVDVDRFKIINDTHGHQAGDQVLTAVAQELKERLGDAFDLARLGGDEFVAIAAGDVDLTADLVAPIRTMISVHHQYLSIECALSVGVTRGANDDAAQRLLSEAGFAMRRAKQSGFALAEFGEELSHRRERTLQVAAIDNGKNGKFVPVAQTIVSENGIVGCELLVRWEQPNGELLAPAQFLDMANEAGIMSSINNLMIESGIAFAARFNNRPVAPFISVNISPPHLSEATFCDRVERLLEEYRVPPGRLMIEVTETDQFSGYGPWERSAGRLRALGVRLAMDDFGSGYSSLERLQHLPITHLKFDRSLVQTVSGPFGEIVGGVARFAKALNIGIIAEGIETLDELASMQAFDVRLFQGYHFHRPESLDNVERRIIDDHIARSGAGAGRTEPQAGPQSR